MTELTIAVAQITPNGGNIEANVAAIEAAYRQGVRDGAGLVVAPEAALTGFGLYDLARDPGFLARAEAALAGLAAAIESGPPLILGTTVAGPRNAAALLQGGRVVATVAAHRRRRGAAHAAIVPGDAPGPWRITTLGGRGLRVGVVVGADTEDGDAAEALTETGAELLVALASEPFTPAADETALQCTVARVAETGLPLVHVNAAGADEGLVFAGGSFALDAERRLRLRTPSFAIGVWSLRAELDEEGVGFEVGPVIPPPNPDLAVWRTLILGTADLIRRAGDGRAIMPFAADPASRITAALAIAALGRDRVAGVAYGGRADAAAALGLNLDPTPAANLRDALLRCVAAADGSTVLNPMTKDVAALGPIVPLGDVAPLKDVFASRLPALGTIAGHPLPPATPAEIERDAALDRLIEQDADPADLARRIAANEWARRRAPIGVKVSAVAFDHDRRRPAP